jgi:cation diffusion facilitator CzcD-associated flavoprotein CzcO
VATADVIQDKGTRGGDGAVEHVPIAIIGTGFGGLGMAIRLLERGRRDFVLLERASDIGGTWRDNTYPGCQCDIPSNLYSFSFAPNPDWSSTFPKQPEIQAYLQRVARDRGVYPYCRFDHEVTGARWDDAEGRWHIETAGGPLTAGILVAAPGGLSDPSIPAIPGAESFEGPAFHSATWDHDVDFKGKRVAVIGTGASAIQFIPYLQPDVERLDVYQRTPPWVMPHPNRDVRPDEQRTYRRFPLFQRLVRSAVYALYESRVIGFTRDQRLLKLGEKLALRHLHRQVKDPELRRKLTPRYRMGCKRILQSDDYFPALASANVDLVTDGVAEIRANSIVDRNGVEREVDVIVWGTGFKINDLPIAHRVYGRDGRSLAETWAGSMQAYRGTAVAGFPNMFFLVGPNTGLGHNSIVFMIEAQIAYVMEALKTMRRRRAGIVEVRAEAQERFNAALQERMKRTVWTRGGCASWYLDEHGRNTTLWPGSTATFWLQTRRFDAERYDLAPARVPARA